MSPAPARSVAKAKAPPARPPVRAHKVQASRLGLAPADHVRENAADRAVARALTLGAPSESGTAAPAGGSGGAADAIAARVPVPRSVDDVLGHAGQPLDASLRAYFEPRFGSDFSDVRVHHDAPAERAAFSVGAQAFSTGRHIVFGRGRWQPYAETGRHLLAHELAHQVQRSRYGDSDLIWRKPLNIADFDAGSFSDATLLAYLTKLRGSKVIEDDNDSDDKARGVVSKWREGGDDYALEPDLKVLLIQEMQSGFTGNDDERAILNLLEYSARPDVDAMFQPGALDPTDLDSDFHGPEEDALRAFYDRIFTGGRKAALAGGAALAAEGEPPLAAPYSHAALRTFIDERMRRIDLIVRDLPPTDRQDAADSLARGAAAILEPQVTGLAPIDRDVAAQNLAGDRAQKDSQIKALDVDIAKAPTPLQAQQLTRKQVVVRAEVLLLDLTMQATFRDIAMVAPSTPATFQALATPLTAAQKKAAQEAITPVTAEEVAAEATGAPPPPPPKFNRGPLPSETDLYDDKVKARIPNLITEKHAAIAAARTAKEHSNPALTRSMDDMQAIANQAKLEVDLVFGHLYDASKFKAFQGDKRDKKGKLTKKGNLRDVWQVEEDRRNADKKYEEKSARFWLFYLIQNDDAIQAINYAHKASPSFDDSGAGQNDEAKLIRSVGDPFVVAEKTRLFEIGRGWDAFKQGSDIFIQLFKDPDPAADRRWLWGQYFVLMHEYLHKLAHKDYHDYADKLGGEHSTEGNTLIEGVDSLFTEIAWSNAVKRAGLPEVRAIVEPDAVKARLAFDPTLLPVIPYRRYDTYEQAVRLVAVVGIYNLYAAYFQGKVDLVGGP